MSTIDEEVFKYNLYMAEQAMLDELSVISIKNTGVHSLQEQSVLNEAVNVTVMKYISKVATNVQNVWNRFKTKMNDISFAKLEDKYKSELASGYNMKMDSDNKTNIPLFSEIDNLKGMKLKEFNASDTEYMSSVDSYIQKFYPYAYEAPNGDKKSSPVEVIQSKIFRHPEDNEAINSELIAKQYIPFFKSYKKEVTDNLGSDIDALNASSNAIKSVINESGLSTSELLSYFLESDEDNKQTDSTGNTSNTDQTGNTANNSGNNQNNENNSNAQNNNSDKDKKKEINKSVINYYKASTSIFSAKMSMLNKAWSTSYGLVKKYCKEASSNTVKDNNGNATTTDNINVTIKK